MEAIDSLPYEWNMKNPEFQLQINDYFNTRNIYENIQWYSDLIL
jgi:hypothetical protein